MLCERFGHASYVGPSLPQVDLPTPQQYVNLRLIWQAQRFQASRDRSRDNTHQHQDVPAKRLRLTLAGTAALLRAMWESHI